MNMIERVAKIYYPNLGYRCCCGPTCPACIGLDITATNKAKAAIASMREPTPDMISFAQSNASVVSLEDRWRMMIDAALKEE